jgi:hypothetical protein
MPLDVEHYKLNHASKRIKSCPGCSVKAGHLVYYRFARFGGRVPVDGDFKAANVYCRDCQKAGRR